MLTEVEGQEFPERQAEPEPQEREWWVQVPGLGREQALPFWEPREREQWQGAEPQGRGPEQAWALPEPGQALAPGLPSWELLVRELVLASVPRAQGLVRVPVQQEREQVPGWAQALPFLVLQAPGRVPELARQASEPGRVPA